jgi:hypothetical protein
MTRFSTKWIVCCLTFTAIVLGFSTESWARYNTGAYRRYMQQQMQMQQKMMQMQQQVMMQAIAQQAAIDKHHEEMRVKASKLAHEREEKRKQDLIAKRKAAQAQGSQSTRSTSGTAVSDKK